MNKVIYFITCNKNKLLELEFILHDNKCTHKIKAQKLDLPELQGEPEYIATKKCSLVSLEIDAPVMIEDTSLYFNALGGLSGPYVK